MSPSEWRIGAGHTQATLAALAGVTGCNPSRTWKRWESGERKASAAVIDLVDGLSKGAVTARSWARVRAEYLARQANPDQAASHAA